MKLLTQIIFFCSLFFYADSQAQCLNVTYSSTNIDCFGGTTGTISAVPNSGTAPYTYSWPMGSTTTSAAGGYTITGLATGSYSVTVVDNLGCDDVFNIFLTGPSSAVSHYANITSNYNGVDISCNGGCDGEAVATASGGSPGYTFTWSNGATTAGVTGLCAGVYCVTTVDAAGCIDDACITLSEPSAVTATITSVVNVNCNGAATGSATVVGTGGGGSYSFLWGPAAGNQTGATATNLSAGSYPVTVTDVNGCIATTTAIINEPTALLASLGPDITETCDGDCDASITVVATGGVTPYAYSFDGGATFSATDNLNNLCAGQYIVDVMDANGCIDTDTINVLSSPFTVSITSADTICQGATGTLLASTSGGVGALNYLWINGVATAATTVYTSGVQFCVSVTDANNCVAVDCMLPDSINFNVGILNPLVIDGNTIGITYQGNPHPIQTTSNYPAATTYNWSPATGLSCTTCPNPLALPNTATQYILEATHTTLGCTSYDTITVYPHSVDTVRLELAPDSTINYCSTLPGFLINGTSAAIGNPLNYGSITYGLLGCFDYTSGSVEGVDTIVWVDCGTATLGTFPVQVCDTTIIYVTTASCVWPGDADNDGIANNLDLLPIGLHHNTTGTTRTSASINYTCQPSRDWGATISGMPTIDLKHVDCNGNGLINGVDTNAIILNWTQTHLKNNSSTTGVDLYIDTATTAPGTTVSLPIVLGSVPNNGYGIAFTINYDPMGIDTNSVSIDYSNSWLGTINNDMIGISKDFYYQGEIEVAMTRIDQTIVNGSGTIGHINLTIKDDVLPKSAFLRLDFSISDVRFIDNNGVVIPTNAIPTQILVADNVLKTSTLQNTGQTITVYPNPTTGNIRLQSLSEDINYVMVYDITGNLVKQALDVNSLNTTLDLENLPSGVYMLRVASTTQIKTIRVIKQ